MKGKKRRATPLRRSLYLMIVVCWIAPLLATIGINSSMTAQNSRTRYENTILSSANYSISILEERFAEIMADSRALSYNGTIGRAYASYLETGDAISLYDTSYNYLLSQYSHLNPYEAVYLIYSDLPDTPVYIFDRGISEQAKIIQAFEESVHGPVLEKSQSLGTRIGFLNLDDGLYMIRNVVSSNFQPYAILVMQCDKTYLFESVENLVWVQDAALSLDGISIPILGNSPQPYQDGLVYNSDSGNYLLNQELVVENHQIRLMATISGELLHQEWHSLILSMILMVFVSGLLLLALIYFFYQNISRPVENLVGGMEHLEQGQLGYHVPGSPSSPEFRYLTDQFNVLSDRLREQFERNNMEHMALHEAKIKALQSQINPHFLNNTLELINWEARMAGNKKVCQMIDALAIMLDAAMDRGGNSIISVKEELFYIDAYLYIISQRFGDRLTVLRDIAPEVLSAEVPRMILQPIVENAIEHGISQIARGSMLIRLYRREEQLVLDVENDGAVSFRDQETIEALLQWDGKEQLSNLGSTRIGIRNVNQRLKILYGPDSGLSIREFEPGKVRSRIVLPFRPLTQG